MLFRGCRDMARRGASSRRAVTTRDGHQSRSDGETSRSKTSRIRRGGFIRAPPEYATWNNFIFPDRQWNKPNQEGRNR